MKFVDSDGRVTYRIGFDRLSISVAYNETCSAQISLRVGSWYMILAQDRRVQA